ncbi:MAG: hypothetical protein RPU39_13795 [Candidatus Sedimenticola sp. (ex Thyasira tokunagai)]
MGLVADLIKKNLLAGQQAEEERKQREARERALALTELDALTSRTPPQTTLTDPDGLSVNLPDARFTPRDALSRSFALADAGLDEKAMEESRALSLRNKALQSVMSSFEDGAVDPQYADFVNKKSVAPGGSAGGVVFNKYAPEEGVQDESSAIRSLAAFRDEKTAELRSRGEALAALLESPELHPLLKADIANSRDTHKPERVKVRRQDGSESYMNAIPNISGGFDYVDAVDDDSEPLVPSGKEGINDSAEAFNIRNRAKILGISEQDALTTIIHSKTKRPEDAWPDFVKLVSKSPSTGYGRRTGKVKEEAAKLFNVAFPGVALPDEEAAQGEYESPDAVKSAYEAGEIEHDEAVELLRGMGFE